MDAKVATLQGVRGQGSGSGGERSREISTDGRDLQDIPAAENQLPSGMSIRHQIFSYHQANGGH